MWMKVERGYLVSVFVMTMMNTNEVNDYLPIPFNSREQRNIEIPSLSRAPNIRTDLKIKMK